jgi:butyrate kinase
MAKIYRIFAINPGSTSTKISLFENETQIFTANVAHDAAKLKEFREVIDQLPYRKETIINEVTKNNISLQGMDAFVARVGGLVGMESGTYIINDVLLNHSRIGFTAKHPINLSSQLVQDFAATYGGKAFVNPEDVDEFDLVARVTGLSDVARDTKGHPLNQKEVAHRYAKDVGRQYEDLNLVISHIGGGITVTAHKKGRMIDSTDAMNGDGPMAPTRAGAIPANAMLKISVSGKETEKQIYDRITKNGGMVDHLGTSDVKEVKERIKKGDAYASLIYDAMAYQIGKYIGAYAAVLDGNVDAILLTGGIANDAELVEKVTKMVKFIAPVRVYAGEFELMGL